MECLLAIVEFTEYQEYCSEHFRDYLFTKYNYRKNLIKLPNDIPKSLIVYGSIEKETKNNNKNDNEVNIIDRPMFTRLASKSHSKNKLSSIRNRTSISHKSKKGSESPKLLSLQIQQNGSSASESPKINSLQIQQNPSTSSLPPTPTLQADMW